MAVKMKLLKQAREGLRARFFETLRHVVSIDDTRDILNEAMAQQNVGFGCAGLNELENFESPYGPAELAPPPSASYERAAPIFITARFRTGSTLLWNLFRNMSGVTAYYEPFNERRWFDPRSRGARVDATHLGVGDYWAEYQGLPELANHYSEEWTRRHLFMPRNAWNPGMQRYIETLIGRASGRAVLQFNRVDLRLPWLRARFPQAKILHLSAIRATSGARRCRSPPATCAGSPSATSGRTTASIYSTGAGTCGAASRSSISTPRPIPTSSSTRCGSCRMRSGAAMRTSRSHTRIWSGIRGS